MVLSLASALATLNLIPWEALIRHTMYHTKLCTFEVTFLERKIHIIFCTHVLKSYTINIGVVIEKSQPFNHFCMWAMLVWSFLWQLDLASHTKKVKVYFDVAQMIDAASTWTNPFTLWIICIRRGVNVNTLKFWLWHACICILWVLYRYRFH